MKPHYEQENIAIYAGDCIDVMKTLPDFSVDAIVTDPPYGLEFMGKEWDGADGFRRSLNAADAGRESAFGRTSKTSPEYRAGHLFQDWCVLWATEALRVLKPGGHLLAFGGSRTYHRLACAVEDAGFEIRDQIQWIYGSGFPKSHNGEWGGTALKPAHEPIVMARKPLIGTVEQNHREHGTGALNIEACRVDAPDGVPTFTHRAEPSANCYGDGKNGSNRTGDIDTTKGRWPANVIHDGSDEVLAAFPEAPGQMADASTSSQSRKFQNVYGAMSRGNGRDGEQSADDDNDGVVGFKMKPGARRLDAGTAARFFYCAKADRSDRDDGMSGEIDKPLLWSSGTQSPGTFQAEGTKRSAKNNHPTVKPTDLMRYLCRLVTPAGGTVLDPFLGSGSTGRGAAMEGFNFIGIEQNPEYVAIAIKRIKAVTRQGQLFSL